MKQIKKYFLRYLSDNMIEKFSQGHLVGLNSLYDFRAGNNRIYSADLVDLTNNTNLGYMLNSSTINFLLKIFNLIFF